MDNTREKLIDLIGGTKYGINTCSTIKVNFQRGFIEKIADHLIANGVTIQKWIPVTEPPKEKGVYLISITHWLDGKPVTREAKWNGVNWLSCYRKEEITPRVTHWMPMPLPEAPKGE